MGYSTDFGGSFEIDKPLDKNTLKLLKGLNTTRRMKRNVGPEFGVEGEFFVNGKGDFGQDEDGTVVNHNQPPSTQPGLWCQWTPNEDGTEIEWDGGEKFYAYVEWIEYLIEKIFEPRGYKLNGEVVWVGEDPDDRGKIVIENNVVDIKIAKITYESI